MSRTLLHGIVVIALALSACTADPATEIRGFSEIAESDPVIEFDPSGTSAILRVTTSLDAVCAVAYGIDGPSGSIATDQDMGWAGTVTTRR